MSFLNLWNGADGDGGRAMHLVVEPVLFFNFYECCSKRIKNISKKLEKSKFHDV